MRSAIPLEGTSQGLVGWVPEREYAADRELAAVPKWEAGTKRRGNEFLKKGGLKARVL